jgi:uncharacterized damage-inducible protein DinB
MPAPKTDSPLVESWRMSNDVNLYLLELLDASQLRAAYGTRTRDVGAQLAHVHGVRLRWLEASAPALAKELTKLDKDAPPTKAQLRKALRASAAAVATFLEQCEAKGQVPNWKGSVASFLGYLIAHEAHHRALAVVALRIAGKKLDEQAIYGMWEWGAHAGRR